jgi:hypothetical protein
MGASRTSMYSAPLAAPGVCFAAACRPPRAFRALRILVYGYARLNIGTRASAFREKLETFPATKAW